MGKWCACFLSHPAHWRWIWISHRASVLTLCCSTCSFPGCSPPLPECCWIFLVRVWTSVPMAWEFHRYNSQSGTGTLLSVWYPFFLSPFHRSRKTGSAHDYASALHRSHLNDQNSRCGFRENRESQAINLEMQWFGLCMDELPLFIWYYTNPLRFPNLNIMLKISSLLP